MDFLTEFDNFADDTENEDFQDIVNFSKKVMEQLGKKAFDDEVYTQVARMFGDEYLADKLDAVIEALGVENQLTY